MARFVFELQPVLDQRQREERRRQRVVAGLEAERIDLERAIRACQQGIALEREQTRQALRGLAGGPAVLVPIRQQAAAVMRLDAQARRLVLQLAGVHRRLEAARADLARASAARKAVELLRQRRYEHWRREQERREQAAADDLATAKAARAAAGEREDEP